MLENILISRIRFIYLTTQQGPSFSHAEIEVGELRLRPGSNSSNNHFGHMGTRNGPYSPEKSD
jgi:hypothetical protein